jgi:hypothetical protein
LHRSGSAILNDYNGTLDGRIRTLAKNNGSGWPKNPIRNTGSNKRNNDFLNIFFLEE